MTLDIHMCYRISILEFGIWPESAVSACVYLLDMQPPHPRQCCMLQTWLVHTCHLVTLRESMPNTLLKPKTGQYTYWHQHPPPPPTVSQKMHITNIRVVLPALFTYSTTYPFYIGYNRRKITANDARKFVYFGAATYSSACNDRGDLHW